MFFSMNLLCFYKQPPTLFAPLSTQLIPINEGIFKDKRLITNPSSFGTVHAVKEDSQSQQYEIDPEKAREALKKLDEQIQSQSTKQISSPKVRDSDVKLTEEQVSGTDGKLEISDSFLLSLTTGLVLFTIFYNILFYTVIKPSIDGA
ncbi:uncharacterized protein LOC113849514 [Abrus precatorius]|uniref:Uncharacterized protein LOC113849514 n=1 Tax=Abrus precatorius TaxID=3816 RepID=A0A8B8JUS7_ABRPR|nr:uncharacterized protein LOC113849514 [Abrus precatorius]